VDFAETVYRQRTSFGQLTGSEDAGYAVTNLWVGVYFLLRTRETGTESPMMLQLQIINKE
jgi:hypothetical protein